MGVALLVYDGDCPYCRMFASFMDALGGVSTVPFSDERAQAVLEVLFSEPGFTMYVVTTERVSWGGRAAFRAGRRVGLPVVLSGFVADHYRGIASFITWLTGRDRTYESPETCETCKIETDQGGERALTAAEKRSLAGLPGVEVFEEEV